MAKVYIVKEEFRVDLTIETNTYVCGTLSTALFMLEKLKHFWNDNETRFKGDIFNTFTSDYQTHDWHYYIEEPDSDWYLSIDIIEEELFVDKDDVSRRIDKDTNLRNYTHQQNKFEPINIDEIEKNIKHFIDNVDFIDLYKNMESALNCGNCYGHFFSDKAELIQSRFMCDIDYHCEIIDITFIRVSPQIGQYSITYTLGYEDSKLHLSNEIEIIVGQTIFTYNLKDFSISNVSYFNGETNDLDNLFYHPTPRSQSLYFNNQNLFER